MRIKFCLMVALAALAGDRATANRPALQREPDPAGLILGDWVIFTLEYDGIVTPQFDPPAERRLARLAGRLWARNNPDQVADPPPPRRGLPPDTLVYRFSAGRFSVWEDFLPVGGGGYRFERQPRGSVLILTWEQKPHQRPADEVYRVGVRFAEEKMHWRHSPDYPVTFRRVP